MDGILTILNTKTVVVVFLNVLQNWEKDRNWSCQIENVGFIKQIWETGEDMILHTKKKNTT